MLQKGGPEADKLLSRHTAGAHNEVFDALDLLCRNRVGQQAGDAVKYSTLMAAVLTEVLSTAAPCKL